MSSRKRRPLGPRTSGGTCPAEANRSWPVSGSRSPTHAVASWWTVDPRSRSSVCSRIDAGSGSERARARTAARTSPITPAATGPRPVTSPTDSRIGPCGSWVTSYQSPPTDSPASPARVTPVKRQPSTCGNCSGISDACSVSATRCSCSNRCARVSASAPSRDTVEIRARSLLSSRRGRSNASDIAPSAGSLPRMNGAATPATTPEPIAVSAQSGKRVRSSSASATATRSPVRIASACA